MNLSVPDYILALKPYVTGKSLESLKREYGIHSPIKLASNENPLGSSPMAIEAIQRATESLNRYPEGSGFELIQKIAVNLGVPPENIVLGNGSDDIISMLARAFLQPGDESIIPRPSFLMYEIMVRSAGATPVFVPLKSLAIDLQGILNALSGKTRMIFLCNPNNPTGTIITSQEFKHFLDQVPPAVIVVIDEAYIEFVRHSGCVNGIDFLNADHALVVLRTFSKTYGLAGLRVGYGIMTGGITDILNRVRQPFNVNSLAQIGALAALDDDAFLKKTLKIVHEGLEYLQNNLDRLGIQYFPTQTNFFLIDVRKDADDIFEKMLQRGVIVRSMKSYGYPEYIRINVGLPEENARFIESLAEVI
jgi:histidinol-phosphate aminotransferase